MTYNSSETMTAKTSSTTNGTPLLPVRQIEFQEPVTHEDIRQTARIATEVFGETSRCLFPDGPDEDQVNYRTNRFDQLFIASLAYKQGIRKRPAKFMVAKDVQSGKVIAFCSAVVEGGGEEEEERFAQTDQLPCQNYSPIPKYPDPRNVNNDVWQSFSESADLNRQKSVGDRKICHIRYLAVDPKIQRTGAGRSLLHLFRKEFKGLPLYLEAENTPSAVHFYVKMGFKQVGQVDFKGSFGPLPIMILEPDTPSLLDQVATPIKSITKNGHLLAKADQISHSSTPTPPTLSA